MKNVSRVALAVCVALGLVACKSNDNHKSTSVPTPVTVDFVEEAKKEEVKAAIGKIAENDAAADKKTTAEVKNVNQGEKITAHKQTYASYVAVLSKKDEKEKVYEVDYAVKLDQPTKETETFKLESLDATYKGKLTATDLDKADEEKYLETHSHDVTFTVKEKHISGVSLAEEGKIKATFEKTAINVKESGLDFAGRLKVEEFDKAPSADAEAEKPKLQHTYGGTYAGMFGGANAEEIAGTFKADKGEFKGAFAAKKEVKEPADAAPAGDGAPGGQ